MINLDARLFHLINGVWTNRVLDRLFPALTDLHQVRIVAFVLVPIGVAFWLYRGRRRAGMIVLGLILTVGLSDAVTHRLLKPVFHRHRPDAASMEVVLRAPTGGGYSFPSNHSANCFAGASFLSAFYPGLSTPLYVAAALVAYSRVYVGVHYPLDVLGGALLGLALGRLSSLVLKKWLARIDGKKSL